MVQTKNKTANILEHNFSNNANIANFKKILPDKYLYKTINWTTLRQIYKQWTFYWVKGSFTLGDDDKVDF